MYQEDWKNAQVAFFDPQGGLGNQTFTINGPNFRVRGVETQIVARVTTGPDLDRGRFVEQQQSDDSRRI